MFAVAILIGIYSYIIFGLGTLSLLNSKIILTTSFFYLLFSIIYIKNTSGIPRINIKFIKRNKLIFGLLFVSSIINLFGALGPELSFDALWYHLSIPKIYLQNNEINFIPGGLFYYSVMPKLIDLIYIPAVMLGNETYAKLIHFSLGLLSLVALFKLSREFFNEKISILSVLIFSSSLVFAWEMTTAYIDLGRTFFEIMSLWGFILWVKNKDSKMLMEAGVMLGLAISTKILSIGSILLFVPLIIYVSHSVNLKIKNSLIFILSSFLIPLPWFIFSFLETGNPFFPALSETYKTDFSIMLLNPLYIIKDIFNLFLNLSDPISPIYIIFLPLLFLVFNKFDKNLKLIAFYSILSIFVWYLIPRTGGGRFILPYLPAFSIIAGAIVHFSNKKISNILLLIIIFVSLTTIGYRGLANSKYMPVILGVESKDEFLSNNLNFDYGDFYDTDGWFKENIKNGDKVLLYGFHNLYYVKFPFVHESYIRKGDWFNYVATQNQELNSRFKDWNLVYENPKTNIKVYSRGDAGWHY